MSANSSPLVLRVLSLALFVTGTASLCVVGALQTISVTLGATRADTALLVSVFAATFALGAPLIQVAFGHLPRRRLLLGGLLLMALGLFASALAPAYPGLLAARMLTALGAAAVSPVASALASTLVAPERQGHALAVVFGGMTAATVLGVPLASWVAAQAGWRPMFAAIGLCGLGSAAALALLVEDGARGAAVRLADLGAVLRSADTAAGLMVMVLVMAAMFTTYTMITPLLRESGAGPAAVSLALMAYGLAGLAGNHAAQRLALAWSSQRSLLGAIGLLLLAFAVLALAPPAYALILSVMMAWAMAMDVFLPAQQRRMVEMRPGMRGQVLALNSSALFAGMALGSLLSGRIAALAGLRLLAPASIALVLAAAVLLLGSRRPIAAPRVR